jgi:hypothetical protein
VVDWYNKNDSGDACAVERAADPLNRTGIDAKPGRDLAHALCAPRFVQSLTDSLFCSEPAEALTLALGPRQPGAPAAHDRCEILVYYELLVKRNGGGDPLLYGGQRPPSVAQDVSP